MPIKEILLKKLTSGRFICTIIVAGTYSYLACTGIFPIEKVSEITLLILGFYFLKDRSKED